MKMKKVGLALLVAALAVSSVTACGKKKTEEPKKVEKTEEKKEEYKSIGDDSVKDAWKVQIKNSLGQDVTGVSVKASTEEAYPENMLKDSDTFKKDETRNLFYKPSEEAAAAQATEGGKELPTEYSVQLTLADGSTVELHAFPFEDMKEGEVKTKDGIAYLEYKSNDGEEVNTYDAEKAVKDQADAEAAAAAEAQAQQEAEAAAQAEAAAAAASQSQSSGSSQNYSNSNSGGSSQSTYTEPAAPAQDNSGSSDDSNQGCVDDGLTY
ncbi:hypothetical protein KGMB01110_08570 [Mediterraneibacter butyricigenes]|uniref:Lipoprotein n=1 Tax=Mediterraneibacter butyricigenes TaxID=2316025 RepID=A0A391NZ05_9FIRM|nr:hypothetical protein [Mediterraneibacter butyricigenes]GCA66421.1 hypothetical protein KGMB01110_08570 [Mediterraneibacter butyricigenes]